jgi:hypothetical protein
VTERRRLLGVTAGETSPVCVPPPTVSGRSDDDLLEFPHFLRRDHATGRLLSELAAEAAPGPVGQVFP